MIEFYAVVAGVSLATHIVGEKIIDAVPMLRNTLRGNTMNQATNNAVNAVMDRMNMNLKPMMMDVLREFEQFKKGEESQPEPKPVKKQPKQKKQQQSAEELVQSDEAL